MISLTVKAVDSGTQVYGVSVDQLQSDINILEKEITGTLNHMTSYNGFSNNPDEQEGNFLALSMTADEGANIKTELLSGTKGVVEVTDGYCVYRITDNTTQKIKITVTKNETIVTKEYGLTNLTCSKA